MPKRGITILLVATAYMPAHAMDNDNPSPKNPSVLTASTQDGRDGNDILVINSLSLWHRIFDGTYSLLGSPHTRNVCLTAGAVLAAYALIQSLPIGISEDEKKNMLPGGVLLLPDNTREEPCYQIAYEGAWLMKQTLAHCWDGLRQFGDSSLFARCLAVPRAIVYVPQRCSDQVLSYASTVFDEIVSSMKE